MLRKRLSFHAEIWAWLGVDLLPTGKISVETKYKLQKVKKADWERSKIYTISIFSSHKIVKESKESLKPRFVLMKCDTV